MRKTNELLGLLDSRIRREAMIAGGSFGVYFMDLADGEALQINGDLVFPAASVIKLPIMVQVMKLAKAGELSLHSRITMDLSLPEYEQEEGSGILAQLESSVSLSIRDLVVLMIVESDNLAANCLLELVGMRGINETMLQLGLLQTRVNRPIEDFEALREDTSNPTTTQDIASLLMEIYKRNLPYSDLMIEILKKQKYTSRIPFFLPDDDEDLKVAHKTGTLDSIVHDVGLVLHPCFDCVVALMTKNQMNISNTTIALARISELCFEYMSGKHRSSDQQLGGFLGSAPPMQ